MVTDYIAYESMVAARETAKWTFWIMWATWFAGAATFSAVVVSLWLARRGEKIDIKCTVGERDLIIKNVVGSQVKKGIAIEIINRTRFAITISNVGWDCGKGVYFTQMFGDKESDTLPKKIDYGERCFLWIDLNEADNWYYQISKKLLSNGNEKRIKGMKLLVSTTTTKPFLFKPEKNLLSNLSQAIEKNRTES
ncbi:hypothetical protein [Kluyvera sp.]